MADSSSFAVEEGDVIMLGTDGLFDNMSEDMLLHHVSKLQVCGKMSQIYLFLDTRSKMWTRMKRNCLER